MYNFLYQEVFWMETIIASLITAAITASATILVGIIAYNFRLRKAMSDIEEIKEHKGLTAEHNNLSREYKSISAEHNGLSKEHDNIVNNILRVSEVSAQIKEILVTEKVENKNRYENLTEKQKNIVNIMDAVKALSDEMKLLVEENKALKEKIQNVENQNQNLKVQNQLLLMSAKENDRFQDEPER